eukprot:g12523.t1
MDWETIFLTNWPVKLVCLILIVAAWIDGKQLRVPNWITFPMVISGLIFNTCVAGWSGLGSGLIGMCVGLICLLPLYSVGGMGAGDVKLLAGVGEIPKGFRLVTVKVNQTKTHSGLIRPGDHVDVILTYKHRENNKQPIQRSLVILQNVRVFATDNRRRISEKEGGDVNAKNMSLVVTPEDGVLLNLAESKGQLTMALRTKDEAIVENPKPIDETVFNEILANKDSGDKQNEEVDDGIPSFQPNFKDFLNGNPTTAPLEETKEQVAVAERKTWKITIFNGPEAHIEEVDMPGEDDEKLPHGQSVQPKSTKRPAARKLPTQKSVTKKPVTRKPATTGNRTNQGRTKKSKPTPPAAI